MISDQYQQEGFLSAGLVFLYYKHGLEMKTESFHTYAVKQQEHTAENKL
jgi:hypothetical protein